MVSTTSLRKTKIDLKPIFDDFKEEGFKLRLLSKEDYDNGWFELLNELTTAPKLSREFYEEIVQARLDDPYYYTIVIEDTNTKQVIGTCSVFGEVKFGRGGGVCAHVEDLVVLKAYAGKKYGSDLLKAIIQISKDMGGYKIILDCFEENKAFYEKHGFKNAEIQMSLRFDPNQVPTKSIDIE
eukprot:CAMPEP_0176445720 /NCGR_PEP_ID=MMETSP0127-20121128/23883_1 /TAXON_ID=938130 /ORGANISM="Platyophrya macrostoma, Strain WH" /LENGTH=181 /DNA_ID=CAMNT_0017831587 /DNA_START=32 /DNA_END=577 /DNA_ORIENTATION=+